MTSGFCITGRGAGLGGGGLRPGTDGVLEAPPLATARAAAASATLEPDDVPLLEEPLDPVEPGADSLGPDPLEPVEAEPEPLRAAVDDDAEEDDPVDDAPFAAAPFGLPGRADAPPVLVPAGFATAGAATGAGTGAGVGTGAGRGETAPGAPPELLAGSPADSDTVGPLSVVVEVVVVDVVGAAAGPAPGRDAEPGRESLSDGLMSHLR